MAQYFPPREGATSPTAVGAGCTADNLLYLGRCIGLNNISEQLQDAIQIYCMVLELKAICGTDYTESMTTDLVQVSNTFACGMEMEDLRRVDIVLDCKNAETSGATYPSTLTPALCLENLSREELYRIYVYLKCLLGAHASQCAPT